MVKLYNKALMEETTLYNSASPPWFLEMKCFLAYNANVILLNIPIVLFHALAAGRGSGKLFVLFLLAPNNSTLLMPMCTHSLNSVN